MPRLLPRHITDKEPLELASEYRERRQQLSVKTSADEIILIVLKPFVVTTKEPVAISLAVRSRASEDRQESAGAMLIKVRALRIVALSAPGIVRAGIQPIPIALFIGIRAVSIVSVVRRAVNTRLSISPISIPVTIPISIAMTMAMMSIAIAIPVSVAVAITATAFSITITIAIESLRVIAAGPGIAG